MGKTIDLKRRTKEHFNKDLIEHPNLLLSKAILKHELLEVKILEEIPYNASNDFFNEREKYWIKKLQTFDKKGYNMTEGGDGASSGTKNLASKLTEEDLSKIYDYLLNSTLTYEEIVEKIPNVSGKFIITDINMGYTYRNPKFDYPLRKERLNRKDLKNKHNAFFGKEKELLELIHDLKFSQLSYDELCDKYNIKKTTLSLINQGKKCYQENEKYPLREKAKGYSGKRVFSEKEMILIKTSLEGNMTMGEISELLHCDRKVISDINKGVRQHNSNWTYPLRKNPLKTGPKSK